MQNEKPLNVNSESKMLHMNLNLYSLEICFQLHPYNNQTTIKLRKKQHYLEHQEGIETFARY